MALSASSGGATLMPFTIHAEADTEASEEDITALLDAAFGPGRETRSAYRLREARAPVASLSFVALDEKKRLLGTIRYWRIRIGESDALLLGPLAVHPLHQGEGIGLALMRRSLQTAEATDFAGVLLVGDPPYYARVGFSPLPAGRLRFAGPVEEARLLWLPLADKESLPSGRVFPSSQTS